MRAPPGNDKPSTSPPVYCIPPVTAKIDNGDSESEEDFSDNSEPFCEEPPTSDLDPREHEPNSTGTKRARLFPDNPRSSLPSSKPKPHTRHRQTEPTRRPYHPYETHAPAWQNYDDDPSTDQYPFGNFGGAWYPGPFGSHPYGGQQVVPYNFNPFAPGGGPTPGPPPPMPTGPTPMMQHPINSGPGMHHGHGLPFPPSGGYSNMHPNYHPNQYPNQYPNQHPNSFQMPPPPYPGYPSIDGTAPPPAYNQPRVSMRHPSIRQDFRPSASSPSPYAEPSQPYPRRTRGRREATPKEHEYQGLHPRPQPPHALAPRHPRPSATAPRFRANERFDPDSEGPMLNKENLEKLEGAEAYMRAANEAGKRPGEKAREEDAKVEPKKEAESEAPMGKKEKPRETKEENDTGVVETRIKNIEDSLRQLVTTIQGTALHTTTTAGVPGIVQDHFRSLRDLESRQLMQQVSSLLGTLPGSLGVGYGPPAGPISPFGSLTPLINLQHLGSLLSPPFTPHSGPINADEPTAVYVQQLQQRIERLERDRDAPTAVKTELAGDQKQAVTGDMTLEYLKLLTQGMEHLNARLGSSQENDEEVASTTTATTDSGTTFRSGRTRPRRRSTATRESFVGDVAPDTTESRPGIIKPTERRSASRASRSSKKAHFEDDISDQKDEDEPANYTHRATRPSSSTHHPHHAKGQTTTTLPSNMNIKATRRGSGGIGGSSSYPPRNEDWSHYETDDGMAEKRGLKRTSTPYVVNGPEINGSTWKPVVPDPPPANI